MKIPLVKLIFTIGNDLSTTLPNFLNHNSVSMNIAILFRFNSLMNF